MVLNPKTRLKEYVDAGREIELYYENVGYSLTYYNDKRKEFVSFCKFDYDTLDIPDVDTL